LYRYIDGALPALAAQTVTRPVAENAILFS
jgi:hypothetical protein